MAQYVKKKNINRRRVTFKFNDPEAEAVQLAGDFNNWNKKGFSLKRLDNGLWQKTIMLPPGKYEYKFWVDGQWLTDPSNRHVCPNCFGTFNSILNVTAKQA